MVWLVQTPSGQLRRVDLSNSEVAILAECAVAIDATLMAFGIETDSECWNRENPFPAMWAETMDNVRG